MYVHVLMVAPPIVGAWLMAILLGSIMSIYSVSKFKVMRLISHYQYTDLRNLDSYILSRDCMYGSQLPLDILSCDCMYGSQLPLDILSRDCMYRS